MNVTFSKLLPRLALGILAAYLILHLSLAWIFAYSLTHPTCHPPTALPSNWSHPKGIELITHDNRTLDAWYYPSGNGAVVLVLLGHGGALGASTPKIGFLQDAGYGVLQIESRACADPAAPVTLGFHEATDAIIGLDYLTSMEKVESTHIAAFGFSMGGVTAIRAAARDERIAAVIAEGGFYNLGRDFVNSAHSWWDASLLYSVGGAFWLQTRVNPWQISPIDDLPGISPRPVYLIYGEHEIESGYGYQQFEAAREPKMLWVVPGGYHGGNQSVATERYEQSVLEFLAVSLSLP